LQKGSPKFKPQSHKKKFFLRHKFILLQSWRLEVQSEPYGARIKMVAVCKPFLASFQPPASVILSVCLSLSLSLSHTHTHTPSCLPHITPCDHVQGHLEEPGPSPTQDPYSFCLTWHCSWSWGAGVTLWDTVFSMPLPWGWTRCLSSVLPH
jgi:hypothetical protein